MNNPLLLILSGLIFTSSLPVFARDSSVNEDQTVTKESPRPSPSASGIPPSGSEWPREIIEPSADLLQAEVLAKPAKASLVRKRRSRKKIAKEVFNTQGSEPDFSKEEQFHSVYKKYNEQPTSDEAWGKSFGDREAKVYKIQKGDTLSGISKTFFGDSFFWSKVWALNNDQIENPHEINPGQNVQFFPGSMAGAPTLTVGKKENPVETLEVQRMAKAEPAGVPMPRRKYAPLLKDIPKSLPDYQMSSITAPSQVELQKLEKRKLSPFEYLNYYLSDEAIDGVGKITAIDTSGKTAGEHQYLYVQLDPGIEAKEFVVQRTIGPVKDPQRSDRQAQMIEVQGQINIVESVNPEKNIYRALVQKAIQPLQIGSLLAPGKMPLIDTTVGELSKAVGAKIIGGQYDQKRSLFGSNVIIFLDGGADQGLQEGQVLQIFADESLRNKESQAIINDRNIGLVKVVRVAKNFSTAYITKSSEHILVGDYVGKYMIHAMRKDLSEMQAADDLEISPPENTPSNNEPEVSPAPSSGDGELDLEL